MAMELAGLAGKGRVQSLRQPSGYHSMKTYYQSVCECERRASERNTALLADLSSLRQRLQLAKENTSSHLTRFTSLKCHYEAYVSSAHAEWVKLTAQQISATTCRHDNRQPDPLITTSILCTVAERACPPLSGHTPIHPTSAPIASSTLLEPRPLTSLEPTTGTTTRDHSMPHQLASLEPTTTTRDQSMLYYYAAKQTLPNQQNGAVPIATTPSSQARLGFGDEEGKPAKLEAERKSETSAKKKGIPGTQVQLETERKSETQAELGSRSGEEEGKTAELETEKRSGTVSDQDQAVQMRSGDLKVAVSEGEDVAMQERSSVVFMDRDSEIQIAMANDRENKIVSTSKQVGEGGTLTGASDHSEKVVVLSRPHSTDPEQLLKELSLSSLSPSPSHSHSVNLSPMTSTHQSPLDIQPGDSHDNIIKPGVVSQSVEQLSIEQDGLLTEHLSVSSDDLSMEESVPASESRVEPSPGPGDMEAKGREEKQREGYSMPDTTAVKEKSNLSSVVTAVPQLTLPIRDTSLASPAESAQVGQAYTALQPPPVQKVQSELSSQPAKDNGTTSQQDLEKVGSQGDNKSISTCTMEQDKNSVAYSDGDETLDDSSSLSLSSSKPTAPVGSISPRLTTSQEHNRHQIIPSNDRGSPVVDDHLNLTDGTLSVSDDKASVEGDMERAHAGTRPALAGKALVTVVVNLLSTLNQHLSIDAESADVMYSLPGVSDNMKGQINSSSVLATKLTKMASAGKDLSTWDPGAVSVVLLQQLSHMTNSMGALLPQQLLEEDAPLLTSCEELSRHMTQQWSSVWPLLVEHVQFLSGCGRSLAELAATLTPALVAPGNPTHREKACLQLLSILQGKVEISSPKPTHTGRAPSSISSLSEASSPELSLKEEAVNTGEEKGDYGVRLEMAMTVFGGGEDDISELLSEASAITEVERAILGESARAGERPHQRHGKAADEAASQQKQQRRRQQLASLTSFTGSPLHLHPSPYADDDVSDSEADSSGGSLPQSSPGYVPTALEQRNSVMSSQASNQSSLHRRIGLGLLSESESDISGLDDSLHPPTTPLTNQHSKRPVEGHILSSHSAREDIEMEDFEFYD